MRAAKAAVVVTVGWCLACSGLVEQAAEQAIEVGAGPGADVELGGDGAVELKTPDGTQLSFDGSASLPSDFPMALPGGGAGWTPQMTAETPQGTAVVFRVPAGGDVGLVDHFRAELAKHGCTEPSFLQMPGVTNLVCDHKGGFELLTATLTGEGDQLMAQIVYKREAAPAEGAPAEAPTDGTPTP